jgi:hypothetical protein
MQVERCFDSAHCLKTIVALENMAGKIKEHTIGLAVCKKEVDVLKTGDIGENVGTLKLIDMLFVCGT